MLKKQNKKVHSSSKKNVMINLLKRFLKTLWGIYALLIFVITLVLVIFCYFIIFSMTDKKKAPFYAHKYVSRNWAKSLFLFFAIKIKIKNKNLLDKKATYVFVSNHLSQLDIPAYAAATSHTFRFLAKEELTKIPLMGYIIKNLYITVNRKDKIARARSMEKMQTCLRDGISVFICPEGTRNKTDQPLLELRDGAFRLAIEAQVPVAVMTLVNTGNLLSPQRPIELSPGTIYCIWSKPIPTIGLTLDDIPVLKEKVIKEFLHNLKSKH